MHHTRRTICTPLLIGIPLGFSLAVLLFQAHFLLGRVGVTRLLDILWPLEQNDVRIVCCVPTHPINHKTQAIHIKNTWGARCDRLIFMSSVNDSSIGAVELQKGFDGPDWLFGKSKEALKYLWNHHRNDAEWFLKIDDDSYVIIENLKSMLREKSPTEAVYYGSWSKHSDLKNGFMIGGSGYVLSKEALRKFVHEALPDKDKCDSRHDGPEDIQIAKCLTNVGVALGNSKDELGRDRFLHLLLDDYLLGVTQKKLNLPTVRFNKNDGLSCCANNVVSFHRVSPTKLYVLEYLLYHVQVDRNMKNNVLPTFSRVQSKNSSQEEVEGSVEATAVAER